MAGNSASYNSTADLLSINNTINVATLVGACFFGILAVFGCILTWRHQRWERQLERQGGVSASDDDLEAGIQGDAYCMGHTKPQSVTGRDVEEHSGATLAGSVKSAPFSLAAGDDTHEPIGMEHIVDRDVENACGHIGDRGANPQRTVDTQPGECQVESHATTVSYATIDQMVHTDDTNVTQTEC